MSEAPEFTPPAPVQHKHRDTIETLSWGAIFIWAGLVFLAQNLGWLSQLRFLGDRRPETWGLILIGAGGILLLGLAIRMASPSDSHRDVAGTLIFAVILIGVGLGDMFSWNVMWPAILIAIGLGMILRRSSN